MKQNVITMEDFILPKDDPVVKKQAKKVRKAVEHKIDEKNEGVLVKYKMRKAEIKDRIRALKNRRKMLKHAIKDEKRRLKAAKLTYKADSIRY